MTEFAKIRIYFNCRKGPEFEDANFKLLEERYYVIQERLEEVLGEYQYDEFLQITMESD